MTTFLSTKSDGKLDFTAYKNLNNVSTNKYTYSTFSYTESVLIYILMAIGGEKCRISGSLLYIILQHFYLRFLNKLYLYPLLSTIYMLFYINFSTFRYTAAYSCHHIFLHTITHDTTFFSTKYPRKALFTANCYLINKESIVVKIIKNICLNNKQCLHKNFYGYLLNLHFYNVCSTNLSTK